MRVWAGETTSPTVPSRDTTEMATLHAPHRLTCLDRPLPSTQAALYAHRKAPVQEAESMRSGPQISSAVIMKLPRARTATIVLILSTRNPQRAKEAAPSHHPCSRLAKTCSHTKPHLYKQKPTTTALYQQTHPPQLPKNSTVAQILHQLRQHRAPVPLTLQHQPNPIRDLARLHHHLLILHLHQICTSNLFPSLPRPPIRQRPLICLPLRHKLCPNLRAKLKPKSLDRQDRPLQRSPHLLQPGNLTQKHQN